MTPPADRDDRRQAYVPARSAGQRLDKFLVEHFSNFSRRQLMRVLKTGTVLVNGRPARAGLEVKSGDRLDLPVLSEAVQHVTEERAHAREALQAVEAVVELYRDDDLLIVNKPAGLPVHGGAGQMHEKTLIDVLRVDILAGFGLAHRLDKDTTGVVALVKGEELRAKAMAAFAADDGGIEKEYVAIVRGVPDPAAGEVALPLLPPAFRGKAKVDEARGKPSRTRYRVVEAFPDAARLAVEPLTGRTHQIRVHLAAIGYPLLVDPLYGPKSRGKVTDARGIADAHLRRTPLHAVRLALPHPRTGQRIEVRAPIPKDMKYVLELLRIAAARSSKVVEAAAPPRPARSAAPRGQAPTTKPVPNAAAGQRSVQAPVPTRTERHPVAPPARPTPRRPVGQPPSQIPTRPQDRPADRPQGRPMGRPTDRPQGRPTDRSQGWPAGRPQGRPSDRPLGRSAGRPQGRPKGRPKGRPTDRSQGGPAGRSQGRPTDRHQGRPQGRPTSQPADRTPSRSFRRSSGRPRR